MVIDTSALLVVVLGEPEALACARAIAGDPRRLVGATTVLEATMVLEGRHGEAAGRELDLLLHRVGATVVDVSAEQLDLARTAWRTYGKGRHRAGLNFGDCFSYALARFSREPLLFKGDGFGRTDIDVVAVDVAR